MSVDEHKLAFPSYPRFFQTIVGLAPGKMKTLTAEDVATMVAVFTVNVGVDPLTTNEPLADAVRRKLSEG